jgi:DNA topoisomerase IB
VPRLKRVSCSGPGLHRVRRGKAFRYEDAAGHPVTDPAVLARIADLVLPPAWEDVWICPVANGHIQATGVDAAGRRQYRYHDQWRVLRDLAKHERILDFAATLPRARTEIAEALADEPLSKSRVLATAVRLLDLGFFRVGSEQYAEANHSYGLATLLRRDVTVSRDGLITFDYVAKGGKRRIQTVFDPKVTAVVRALKRRHGGGDELLAWRDGRRWVDVRSRDINEELRRLTRGDYTAKDFRTWNATVLAAVGLAVSTEATSATARKRAVTRVVKEVATYLGNTPAVCRASYIDPRVIDLYDSGVTVADALDRLGAHTPEGLPATHGRVERAVLDLLRAPAAAALAS